MWYTLDNSQGCESLPCLQEQEVDCSEESCLDGVRFAQSRLADSNGMSFSPGNETEFSIGSRSGTMFAPSTESRGEGRSMSSAEVSHAKTSAAPEEDSELSAENGVDYGANTQGSFARYDRDSCSWKTAQCSLFGGLESFSGTWPKQGIMLHGRCYPLVIAAHRTSESGCGLSERFPTPTVFGNYNRKGISPRSGDGLSTYVKKWPTPQSRDFKSGMASRVEKSWRNLNDWVEKFPTPCRTDYKGAGKTGTFRDRLDYAAERGRTKSNVYPTPGTNGMCVGSGAWAQMGRLVREGKMTDKERHQIGAGNGGKLNPDWIEWLMGWPIGWTALKPLETERFRLWLHGRFAN